MVLFFQVPNPSPGSASSSSSRCLLKHDNEVILQTVTVSLLPEHALDKLHAYAFSAAC
jgi:hypothetical protein